MGHSSDVVVLDDIDDNVSDARPSPITLILEDTTIDSKSSISHRSFELSSGNKVVIGRSSKTISKGLIPAAGNGFFDSPVVSREHASITADLKEGVVRLTDEKSLHGTSVNGTRLEAGVPFILSTGDKLRFGAHVARALDIFHPTECKVEIVHAQPAAPVFERARSYCAPESVFSTSDSESDGYDSNSDEPRTKSVDGGSVAECDSPTQTGGIQIPEAKAAEAVRDVNNVRLPSLEEAMLLDADDGEEDDFEAEYEKANYTSDSDDESSIDNEDEMDDDVDDEIEEDEYDEVEENDDEADEEAEEGVEEEEDIDEAMKDNEFISELRVADHDVVALMAGDTDKDGSEFLEHKIRQFMERARKEGKAMDERLREFKAKTVSKVSTPEPTSAETPTMAEVAAAFSYHQTNVAAPVAASSPTPVIANNKLDISAILNPSSPSARLSGIGCTTNESIETPPMASFAEAATEATANPDDVYDIYKPSQYQHLVYDTEDLSAAACAWRMPVFETTCDVPAPANSEVRAREAHVLCNAPVNGTEPAVASYVPTPAAPLTPPRKRKMDEVADEDAHIQVSTAPGTAGAAAQTQAPTPGQSMKSKASQAQTQTISQGMLTPPPADDGPAPKRQATSQSVAAKSQTKSKAWAAVEMIGIAALGGAVVLGSLIYTAPTF